MLWSMQDGLSVLTQDGHIFNCYDDMSTTMFYAELGASRAMLAAGYAIESLMLKYKEVDWTDKRNWNCSGRLVGNDHLHEPKFDLDLFLLLFCAENPLARNWQYILGSSWSNNRQQLHAPQKFLVQCTDVLLQFTIPSSGYAIVVDYTPP